MSYRLPDAPLLGSRAVQPQHLLKTHKKVCQEAFGFYNTQLRLGLIHFNLIEENMNKY